MHKEFERDIVRYLVQENQGIEYIKQIDSDYFNHEENKFAFTYMKQYVEQNKFIPPRNSFYRFVYNELSLTEENSKIDAIINSIYKPYESVRSELFLTVKEYLQKQSIIKLLASIEDLSSLTDQNYSDIANKISAIAKLDSNENLYPADKFVRKDFTSLMPSYELSVPSFLDGLNSLRTTGGFQSPELSVIVSGAKGFKTGMLLNLAVDYMLKGMNIIYIDCENGVDQINSRIKQIIAGNCTHKELYDKEIQENLRKRMEFLDSNFLTETGDIAICYVPSGSHFDVVEAKIEEKIRDGFRPDILIYDYIDKFTSGSHKGHEDSQKNYDRAIVLNNKFNTFSFTVSQTNRDGLEATTLTAANLAKDFQKVSNAHAVFALNRNRFELDNGLAHLTPLAQRAGERYIQGRNEIFLRIDESTQLIKEITDPVERIQLYEEIFDTVVEHDIDLSDNIDII